MTSEMVIRWVLGCARLMREQEAYLTHLDSAIGDADHGANMTRGFSAAELRITSQDQATSQAASPGQLLILTGDTLVSSIGGASGPLWGSVFRQAGVALGEHSPISLLRLSHALGQGLMAVMELGAAHPGDKTMVDALSPAVEALHAAVAEGADLSTALAQAQAAADQGAQATAPLLARKGRASYLGERSVGHIDPGAASTALILTALNQAAQGPNAERGGA